MDSNGFERIRTDSNGSNVEIESVMPLTEDECLSLEGKEPCLLVHRKSLPRQMETL